ncbi:MAG: hypothetical protein JXR25_00045, partial [Pontiellaceae bacterium]|nr:hypothetical protein [Pontiellaceae bacterium]
GPMMDFGCHRIEVLMDLFGAVSEVQSQLLNLHFEREVEDTACASILFENRVHAVLRVSHAVQEARDTLETCGTKGTIRVPVLNEGSLYVKTEAGERTERHPPHPNFHLPLIENFTAAVIEGNEPIVNGATGKGVTEILDRIYERAWKGQI